MSILKVLIIAVIFFFSSVNQSTAAGIKVKIGYLTLGSGYANIWVTKDAGIFEKYGLDAQLVYIPPRLIAVAMLAGEIQLGMGGAGGMIEATLRGADFVALGSIQKTPSVSFLVTRKEITKPIQLKGKKLGISRIGAAPHRILELALPMVEIDPKKDVTFLEIGNTAVRLVALTQGSIDGTLLTATSTYIARKLGHNVLLDVRDMGIEYLASDINTTRSFIKKNEEAVRRYVKSVVAGIHYYLTHKEQSIKIMSKYMREDDPEILEVAYNINAEVYERKPYISLPGLKQALKDIATRNPKAKQAKPEQFYESKYIRELDESGFIDNLYK